MNTASELTLRGALADPALRESLLVSALLLLLSGGLTYALSWMWVLRRAIETPPLADLDAVLVCGHVLRDGRPSVVFLQRLQRAARLAERFPRLPIIVAGGGAPSEASVGRDWLLDHGVIDADRIRLETTSLDTFENLRHTRSMLAGGERIGLVSSRFHLARVLAYARQLGLAAVAVPAESRWHPTRANLAASLREAALLCWFLSGRFWARLARRRRLLARIR
ncbi:MAG: YdcF family protein [Gammaproteobacteria bacterium]|jgi:uncharacterized SAM-binding protein YcdF (DUF218 family)|nr:YdcF family protein [Gammaproteobacteria bacterium]